MVQRSCSSNLEMCLKHCINQKALLCNKMFLMVWWMWSSIDPLKQFSLGGNPHTHLWMCTSHAFLPLLNFFHKMAKGIDLFLLFCLKLCNWHVPLTCHFYLMSVPHELSSIKCEFFTHLQGYKAKKTLHEKLWFSSWIVRFPKSRKFETSFTMMRWHASTWLYKGHKKW